MHRPTWDEYFASVASLAATRSTCKRASVGCVLVVNNQIVATGYNGSAPGKAHCTDEGCYMDGDHCIRTIHAEVNAIAQAARNGVPLKGAVAYVTHTPCMSCCKALAAAGIQSIHAQQMYGTHSRAAESLYGLRITHGH